MEFIELHYSVYLEIWLKASVMCTINITVKTSNIPNEILLSISIFPPRNTGIGIGPLDGVYPQSTGALRLDALFIQNDSIFPSNINKFRSETPVDLK